MLINVLLASALSATTDARGAHRGRGFLALDLHLHPAVVAHALVAVEDDWRTSVVNFLECNKTVHGAQCDTASSAFQKSCSTIAETIVQASSGERDRVQEYMEDVCGQAELTDWHSARCNNLTASLLNAMVYDASGNREYLASSSICADFWSRFLLEESARIMHEQKEKEARAMEQQELERKVAMERIETEKKAAELAAEENKRKARALEEARAAEAKHEQEREQAERERQAAEKKAEMKREAERKLAEATRQAEARQAEARKNAEEAKKRAAEIAAELADKENLALREAEEAKHRLEEAQAAAAEANRALDATSADANKTSINATANITLVNSTIVESENVSA